MSIDIQVVAAIVGIIASVVAIISAGPIVRFVKIILKRVKELFERTEPSKKDVAHRLLRYFWEYQLSGETQESPEKSWAVKESQVIEGKLKSARNNPGLGAAVFSFDLATRIFSKPESESRLNEAIGWAKPRTEEVDCSELLPLVAGSTKGHLQEVRCSELFSEEVSCSELFSRSKFCPRIFIHRQDSKVGQGSDKIRDLRHTLAFAILLAISGQHKPLIYQYVYLVVRKQNEGDGGWDAYGGWSQDGKRDKTASNTPSELLTALYAVIFLGYFSKFFSSKISDTLSIQKSQKRGIDWMLKEGDSYKNGLWQVDRFFSDRPWSSALVSAWVLRGMSLLGNRLDDKWVEAAGDAIAKIEAIATTNTTWEGTEKEQQFRVEARIAAALYRCNEKWLVASGRREQVESYLEDWRKRAKDKLDRMDEKEWDLSTVTYLLDSLYTDNELIQIRSDILNQ